MGTTTTTPPERHLREALLSAAIEHQPLGVFIVRFDGGHPLRPPIVYVNEAFCTLSGYSKSDIAAGLYPAIVGPDTDRELIVQQATRVAAGQRVTTHVTLYHRDGTPFPAEIHAHPIDFPTRFGVLTIEDITERRSKERTLALLTEAVEQASDFVIVTDANPHARGGPRIVYANRALFEATGFSPADLIGKPYTAIYSPKNDPGLMNAIREAIESGKPNYREMLAARKDGGEFWIEFVAKPFSAGGETYRLSIGRDITARKRTLNQIALLFQALEQSPNRIALLEPDDSGELAVSYENEPAARAGSERLLSLWRGESATARRLRKALLAGESVLHIAAEQDAGGAPAVVELTARGVRNGSELGAVLTIERVLATAATARAYQSQLITFARLLPALAEASDTEQRLLVLRTLLLETFEAEIEELGTAAGFDSVQIATRRNTAHFVLAGRSYLATWARPLSDASVTALRFCIEAAIEQETLGTASPT